MRRCSIRASRVSQSTISRAARVFFSSRIIKGNSGKALAIFPELPKPRAVQRLSNAAWVVQLGNPCMKELQDALAVLRVEFVEFPVNLG